MGNVINTNVKALMASNALNKNGRVQQNVMESLSTGKSINRASDNAAGLSIRETMTAQINGLNAAVKNANDSISMLQTADGALNETSTMLQRMREMAVLSVNDTYSTAQKTAMATEFNQLSSEIDRIATQTQWNGMAILNGSGGLYSGVAAGSTGVFAFQVGANNGQVVTLSILNMAITSQVGATSNLTPVGTTLGALSGATIATAAGAATAITSLDSALTVLNSQRSTIGAMVNRLTHAVDNLTNVAQNATDSRSKVEDTDYAAATSELARTQIIAQAATAILAQANQQPQSVLSLLK
jgi:flagellin